MKMAGISVPELTHFTVAGTSQWAAHIATLKCTLLQIYVNNIEIEASQTQQMLNINIILLENYVV